MDITVLFITTNSGYSAVIQTHFNAKSTIGLWWQSTWMGFSYKVQMDGGIVVDNPSSYNKNQSLLVQTRITSDRIFALQSPITQPGGCYSMKVTMDTKYI